MDADTQKRPLRALAAQTDIAISVLEQDDEYRGVELNLICFGLFGEE